MSAETPPELKPSENRWYDATLALLVGTIAFGAMVFHGAAVQTPNESPPVEAAPLVVIATVVATISYILLKRKHATAYVASAITGVLVVVFLALIAGGVVGELKPGTNPIGPLSYAVLAVALTIAAILAQRERPA